MTTLLSKDDYTKAALCPVSGVTHPCEKPHDSREKGVDFQSKNHHRFGPCQQMTSSVAGRPQIQPSKKSAAIEAAIRCTERLKIVAAVGSLYYPISEITNEASVVFETESCPICCSDFEHEESKSHSKFETVKTTLPCGHQVHLQCLLRWFSIQNSGGRCPVCRTKVPTECSPSSSILPPVLARSLWAIKNSLRSLISGISVNEINHNQWIISMRNQCVTVNVKLLKRGFVAKEDFTSYDV